MEILRLVSKKRSHTCSSPHHGLVRFRNRNRSKVKSGISRGAREKRADERGRCEYRGAAQEMCHIECIRIRAKKKSTTAVHHDSIVANHNNNQWRELRRESIAALLIVCFECVTAVYFARIDSVQNQTCYFVLWKRFVRF